MQRVFIAGGHTTRFLGKGHPDWIWKKHADFGTRVNPTSKDYIGTALRAALADVGQHSASLVDQLFVGNFAGELFESQGHMGAGVAHVFPASLTNKPSMRVEGACASGGLAVSAAATALRAGSANVAVALGVEVQSNVPAGEGAGYLARASDFARQSSIDKFVFPCLFARRVKAYARKYGEEQVLQDLGHIAAKAYANAALNDKAQLRTARLSAEHCGRASALNPTFLANEEFRDYLRLSDCSQVSDGASAVVLCTEQGARDLGVARDELVEIVGLRHGCGDLYADPADLTAMDTTRVVAAHAMRQAGVSLDEVKVAELHDCFTMAEALSTEAVGLVPAGQGAGAARAGLTQRDGKLPVNCGGGLLAWGHPVGATGVKQVHEIVRQIRGQCGDYQVVGDVDTGLAVNMGGDDKTVVATVLRRPVW